MENVEKIRKLATQIRNTITKMKYDEFPNSSFLLQYPRGCCGDASNLLAKFFSDNGIECEYVWGMRGEQSHAWLECGDLIVDITADQFPEIKEKILITTNKSWHKKFKGQKRSDGDFEKFEPYNRHRLSTVYKNILLRISQEKTE
ncbi:transglutaminase domain-containing protein [Clostridium sporogenes]|uniref:transglutaminase domain-containing protein n=1 Tax=Clostridium TaxID=1485 RepID=UPI000E01416E|nr:transglutaminase domain-containing protein [Clostridium sporogenes]MCW6084244.1 transglutaminase-like domain-containing protein [Clostridium sporogenes]STC79756.1 transglutaminase-like superfamily [Clostridium botulinum]